MRVVLIGCGGIGAWLGQALAKHAKPDDTLILVDKDVIEKRNLDRQLFTQDDIGRNKCEALRRHLTMPGKKIATANMWYDTGSLADLLEEDYRQSVVFVGVDNNRARIAALQDCATNGVPCIVAANEYVDAEAYISLPDWVGTDHDPLVYYPELRDTTGASPLNPGCTGAAQEADPQLAFANMWAASYAIWLYYAWLHTAIPKTIELGVTSEESKNMLLRIPYYARNTWGRIITRRLIDAEKKE